MTLEKIIKTLKSLKKLGATGVKQSFEDEGASFKEVLIMNKLIKKLKLNQNVKIGGCEAKNDIDFCVKNKITGIVAPMVESDYALKKFYQAIPKKTKSKIFINIETINAIKNFKKIASSKNLKNLDGIVFGRSDIAGSLELEKKDVNSKKITHLIKKVILLAKKRKKSLQIKLGGSISFPSKETIFDLYNNNFITSFETRNVEIKISNKNLKNFEKIIKLAFQFEIEWNQFKLRTNKINYNNFQKKFLKKRVKEIKARLVS